MARKKGSSGKRVPGQLPHKGGIHPRQHRFRDKVIAAKAGTQEKITVHGETVLSKQLQERGKSLEDKMDRARQSRVETSLWCDPRLEWIPAFCGNDVVVRNEVAVANEVVAGMMS